MIINDDYMNSDEISKLLNLSGSNVRKYSAALAKSGYEFKTDNKKKRYYTHRDYETLQKLQFLIQRKNLSLEVASNTIVEGLERNRSASGAHDEQIKNEENNRS
ncbi:MerR family transcriptional regulator, partial [Priestia megaterium]|uniref:MerR family transcriptional regulator n=1 Tax=Priestia megaterium TaxID=1404 RepID=UPI0027828FFD